MKILITATLLAIASLGTVSVQAASDHASHGTATSQADMQMVDAQVKKVDKTAGKVTLAHGPLVNLNMPAMTMAFAVKDAVWLKQMKAGDRIRFVADQVDGVMTVVRFEAVK